MFKGFYGYNTFCAHVRCKHPGIESQGWRKVLNVYSTNNSVSTRVGQYMIKVIVIFHFYVSNNYFIFFSYLLTEYVIIHS